MPMSEVEAKAVQQELDELRFQVVHLAGKACGVSLSPCMTGEALSCIEGAIQQLRAERMQLIRACNKVIHRMRYRSSIEDAKRYLNEVVGKVTGNA